MTLSSIFIFGLAAFYFVEFVRKLPLIETLVFKGVKPFACNICMAGWGSIGVHLVLFLGPGFYSTWTPRILSMLAAAGIALAILYFEDAIGGSKEIHLP